MIDKPAVLFYQVRKQRSQINYPGESMLPVAAALLSFLATAALLVLSIKSGVSERLLSGSEHPASKGTSAPQIGGLHLVPVSLVVTILAFLMGGIQAELSLWGTLSIVALLALTGVADDSYPIPAIWRLLGQLLAAGLFLFFQRQQIAEFFDTVPFFAASGSLFFLLVILYIVGTINAVNFMDGADWALVSTIMPGLVVFCLSTLVLQTDLAFSIFLFSVTGGFAAFACFNYPPAKIYLGDGGSLPIGFFIAAVGFYFLLAHGTVAGFLPFGYIYCDALLTLIKRLREGQNLLASHSGHAYQDARGKMDDRNLFLQMGAVSLLNSAIAFVCLIIFTSPPMQFGAFLSAGAISVWLYLHFRRDGKPPRQET